MNTTKLVGMNMSEPRKWTAEQYDDESGWFVADEHGNDILMPDADIEKEIAVLIAAAPDLLEALRFIVNDCEPGEDARLTVEGYNRACAAIAKAGLAKQNNTRADLFSETIPGIGGGE